MKAAHRSRCLTIESLEDRRLLHGMEPGWEVHQWLTKEAFNLYNSQFVGSELAAYLVAPGLTPSSPWDQIAAASHNYNGDDNVIEGSADEDTTDNPFGQLMPYLRHFCNGGDGEEIYDGLLLYDSALTQAERYWQDYVLNTYVSTRSLSYYYLGHVMHLLEDMTVPAHVHDDQHALGDAYESWVEVNNDFQYYTSGGAAPGWNIAMPASLEDSFRLTADYTHDYPSDDYAGEAPPEYDASFRAPGRHRPDLIVSSGTLSDADCETIAGDLMPWAIEQTASLMRLYYSEVDATAPQVQLLGLSASEASPTQARSVLTASGAAVDPQSGVDADGYHFFTERKTGGAWVEQTDWGPSSGRFTFGAGQPLAAGLYRTWLEVQNGAGQTGSSPYGYFTVVPTQVTGRHVFYNNSAFDGNNPAPNAQDDAAVATDKIALRPGGPTATFANYTSYSRGLNGIMVDVQNLIEAPALGTVSQFFELKVGNDNHPATWAAAPGPAAVAVRAGAGDNGADRVTLLWPDGAIKNDWLQVKVLANRHTGLVAPDVFYFGSAIGESGNDPANAQVDLEDELAARGRRSGFSPAALTNPHDFNRDGRVNASDELIARHNPATGLGALQLITVPAAGAPQSTVGAAVVRPLPSAEIEGATVQLSPQRAPGWLGQSGAMPQADLTASTPEQPIPAAIVPPPLQGDVSRAALYAAYDELSRDVPWLDDFAQYAGRDQHSRKVRGPAAALDRAFCDLDREWTVQT